MIHLVTLICTLVLTCSNFSAGKPATLYQMTTADQFIVASWINMLLYAYSLVAPVWCALLLTDPERFSY